MKTEYCLFADLHLEAPHATLSLKDLYAKKSDYGKNCLLLGDIYDVSNCRKKELKSVREKMHNLKKYFGNRYIKGNHECDKPHRYYFVQNGIMFCHGHTLFWSDKKVKRWENKRGGKSSLRYFLYRFKHMIVRRGKELKLSESKKEELVTLMIEHGCHTIVFGHTHKSCDIKFYDKRIVALPRGMTIMEL